MSTANFIFLQKNLRIRTAGNEIAPDSTKQRIDAPLSYQNLIQDARGKLHSHGKFPLFTACIFNAGHCKSKNTGKTGKNVGVFHGNLYKTSVFSTDSTDFSTQCIFLFPKRLSVKYRILAGCTLFMFLLLFCANCVILKMSGSFPIYRLRRYTP